MKHILVTGANKGIGLALVTKLLEEHPDTYLLLGSRDVTRGQNAVKQVVEKLGTGVKDRVELLQIDVSSDESVTNAVKTVIDKLGDIEPLYGLINNAGGTADSPRGYINLNTYSVYRVCEAFLPLIQKNQGRIVQISSGSAPSFVSKCSPKIQSFFVNKNVMFSEVEKMIIQPFLRIVENSALTEELQKTALVEVGLGDSAYGLSKACVNAYTLELARRFPNLLINACSPGWIQTDMTLPYAKKVGKTPEEMGILPVDMGTIAAKYLMMGDLMGDIEGYQSGRYYGSDAKWSPFHKYRSPGTTAYDGKFP